MSPVAASGTDELAGKLRYVSGLRGAAALALGTWALAAPPTSADELIYGVGVYWSVEGLVVFAASLSGVTVGMNRVFALLRSLAEIVAAVVLMSLPLHAVFGPWRPGQLVLFAYVVALVVSVIALQALTAAFDFLMSARVRRRISGEWSVMASAVVSLLFGLCLVATLAAPPPQLGRGVAVVGIVGGLAVIYGAMRLRMAHHRSAPVVPS